MKKEPLKKLHKVLLVLLILTIAIAIYVSYRIYTKGGEDMYLDILGSFSSPILGTLLYVVVGEQIKKKTED